jgi:hypothetical protein
MAVIETDGAIIRGKMGAITFAYRRGTNYSRAYGKGHDPKTPAQLEQRARYGQFQRLGSLWNRDFITPYFQGDRTRELPFNSFIKYNWARWDKVSPPWKSALPFWDVPQTVNFGSVPFPGTTHDTTPLKILADVPAELADPTLEFYGFFTVGEAAHFVKLRKKKARGEGWKVFDTDIILGNSNADIFYICWFQRLGKTTPYCMPVNQQALTVPSCAGWQSFSCAVEFSLRNTTLTISLFSDIPTESLGRDNNGYVRLWNNSGETGQTITATPEQQGAGRAAYCEIDIRDYEQGNIYIQAWFQDIANLIPVSPIAKDAFYSNGDAGRG